MACPETSSIGGTTDIPGPPGTARTTQKKPRSGGRPGLPNGRSPWGREYDRPIHLNSDQSPAVPRWKATPLTPSLLVRAANPRHDDRGARNATIRGGTVTGERRYTLGPCAGSAANTRPARGIRPRVPCDAFLAPGACAVRGFMAQKATTGTEMNNSPYLDQPFVPLAVALRPMLAETEAKIVTAAPAERARLRERAEVLRDWITPKPTT